MYIPFYVIVYSLIRFLWVVIMWVLIFIIKIVCSAKTVQKEIAISFDDGPVNELYPTKYCELLKQENNYQPLFSVSATAVQEMRSILKQIKEAGILSATIVTPIISGLIFFLQKNA